MNQLGITGVLNAKDWIDAVGMIGLEDAMVLLVTFTACVATIVTALNAPKILNTILIYKMEKRRLEEETKRKREQLDRQAIRAIVKRNKGKEIQS